MLADQKIKNLQKIKGKARGVTLNTDMKYITEQKGEKKLKEIVAEMNKIEPNFNPKKIKNTDWVPLKWRVLFLLITKNILGWKSKEIFAMGRQAPINSFIVKMILRYFNFFKRTCSEAPKYWKKHYSVGELITAEYSDEEKYVIFKLKKFKIHPVLCTYLKGYFLGMADLTNRSEKVTIEETKCPFEEDAYHEFIMEWK